MARYAVQAAEAGARIIGACCGSTPAHLTKMRAALGERLAGDR
jgi:5-methyltetrahydrofolate--homocysteine methyltransferase